MQSMDKVKLFRRNLTKKLHKKFKKRLIFIPPAIPWDCPPGVLPGPDRIGVTPSMSCTF